MAEVEIKNGFKIDGFEKSEFVCALCEGVPLNGSSGLMLLQKVQGGKNCICSAIPWYLVWRWEVGNN